MSDNNFDFTDVSGLDRTGGFEDMDPPTTPAGPWVDGSSASGFGTSVHSSYSASYFRPGTLTASRASRKSRGMGTKPND